MNKIIKYNNLIKIFYFQTLSSNNRLSVKKQAILIKKLSFLIKSGLSTVECLNLIKKQSKSEKENKIFEAIIADLKNGKSLAESFKRRRGLFSSFVINIIKAGELCGNLILNLSYLADELKKKEIIRRKILGALLYPIIVILATLIVSVFLIIYIFPKILPIFQGLGIKLPLSTRIIIFISNLIKQNGLYIFIGLIIIGIFCYLLVKRNYKIKLLYSHLILKCPILGKILKNYNITNSCRTLGLLLRNNISISQALIITSQTINNLQYKNFYYYLSQEVIKGKNISDIMSQKQNIFPDTIYNLIAIGEKTGNLSDTLIYLSEYYENELDDLTKNLSNSIEPFLMIIMGIIVGFVAISFISPIYEITNNLKK